MNVKMPRPRILLAEDQPRNVAILQKILPSDRYNLVVSESGKETLAVLGDRAAQNEEHFDLILLDIMMPEMDGFETIKAIRSLPSAAEIPVIFLTSQREPEFIARAFDLGAVDYVFKPFNSRELLARVHTHLENARLRNRLMQEVERRSGEIIQMHKNLLALHHEMLIRLGMASEYRDNETGMHIQRIGHFSKCIGLELGLNLVRANQLEVSAVMHDVGKIGIPDSILLKPGKLTPEEFDQMKRHTLIGHNLLSNINSELVKEAALIALGHHEKWDGTGYPNGLSGNQIPLSSRIVAIVDVFDALTSERPYKRAWTIDEATALIKSESGRHFDPAVVAGFMNRLDEIIEIKNRYADR